MARVHDSELSAEEVAVWGAANPDVFREPAQHAGSTIEAMLAKHGRAGTLLKVKVPVRLTNADLPPTDLKPHDRYPYRDPITLLARIMHETP